MSNETSLFSNRSVFDESYVPETVVGRDEPLDELTKYLSPLLRGQERQVMVYGGPGTGKTTVVSYILSELESAIAEHTASPLTIAWVDCSEHTTSHQARTALTNRLTDDSETLVPSGQSSQSTVNQLIDAMNEVGGHVVTVLENIHDLSDDSILYTLSRARANYDLDARPSIIGITPDLRFPDSLRPKVSSTFTPLRVHLGGYGEDELRSNLYRFNLSLSVLREREPIQQH